MALRSLDGVDVAGRRVLVRVDFNTPMNGSEIADDTRLRAALRTIAKLRAGGAKVILLSHFGRPQGRRVTSMSLRPAAGALSALLGARVEFASDCVGAAAAEAIAAMGPGSVLLLENLRYHPGEEANDPAFAQALAMNGDLYVGDAFSTAHRAHASTEAIAHLLPAYAGEEMRKELATLEAAIGHPDRPVMGVVGGAKISTKLALLRNLTAKLDVLAIGGGMANTFLIAQGWSVGASIREEPLVETAAEILALALSRKCEILLPIDVVVSKPGAPGLAALVRGLGDINEDERILDAGPRTVSRLIAALDGARTLVWNGPLGVFETPPFDQATNETARHAAALVKSGQLVAVAGGGDTVAALNHAGVANDFTFVSNAGGAFLEWLEGKTLPGVTALQG